MELKQYIPEFDNRIKIAAALSIVLLTGFIATNIGSTQSHNYKEKLDSSGNIGASYDAPARTEEDAGDAARSRDISSQQNDRKVITTVRTTIKVDKVESAMQQVSSNAESLDGFIESSSVSQDREKRGSMTIAIPEENLSEFENSLEDNWRLESRDIDRDDVTDSYNELETEIESLKAEHQRLKELINQTDDVENLIRLQERMSEVRSQINYKQQRLDRLEDDIQYSKVHLTLEGPQSFKSQFEIQETLSDAYSAVFESVKLIIIGVAYLLPLGVLYGVYRLAVRVKDRRL